VSRRKGFLDGGDRRLMFEAQTSQAASAGAVQEDLSGALLTAASDPPTASLDKLLMISSTPTSTLLVTNLPIFLFSQVRDLHPLFLPFGKIQKLEILAAVSGTIPETIKVIVAYSMVSSAQEAKEILQGQSYSTYALDVEFITDPGLSVTPDVYVGSKRISTLNPFAPAFILEPPSSQVSLGSHVPYTPETWSNAVTSSNINGFDTRHPSLPAPTHTVNGNLAQFRNPLKPNFANPW
jgi:hypothetical protein